MRNFTSVVEDELGLGDAFAFGPRIVAPVARIDHDPRDAEAELPRVCDRFYRSPGTQGQGSGLGLAIVASIVQRHRATLMLHNNDDGAGLTVSLAGLSPAALG